MRPADRNTLTYTLACSLTLSCTGLEAYSVWQQIPSDFCSFWNNFSALFSAGRPWCLQIVPLSLPLGMFIKFLQSSLYFFSFPSLHCLGLTPLELELSANTWRSPYFLCQEYSSIRGPVYSIPAQWCLAQLLPKRHLNIHWLYRHHIVWAMFELI